MKSNWHLCVHTTPSVPYTALCLLLDKSAKNSPTFSPRTARLWGIHARSPYSSRVFRAVWLTSVSFLTDSGRRPYAQPSPRYRTIWPRPLKRWIKCTSTTIPTATPSPALKVETKTRSTESDPRPLDHRTDIINVYIYYTSDKKDNVPFPSLDDFPDMFNFFKNRSSAWDSWKDTSFI